MNIHLCPLLMIASVTENALHYELLLISLIMCVKCNVM